MKNKVDIIKYIHQRLWDEEPLMSFIDRNIDLVIDIQSKTFRLDSKAQKDRHEPDFNFFLRKEFIEVFKNLRKILENETTINHNKYSNEDLYNKIVYPIMKYILYPEHLEIHTIHQN